MIVLDIIAGACIVVGAVLALTAAVGIVRFTDTLSRMHPATKPQVIGMLLVLTGAVIELRGNVDIWMLVLVGLFALVTAPVIAHMVGRVAYREQRELDGMLAINEFDDRPEPY